MKKKRRRRKRRGKQRASTRRNRRREEPKPYDFCQYRDCKNESDIIVVINGQYYGFCEKHYHLLDKVLDRVFEKKGTASLEDLKVYTRGNRITHIAPK